MIFVTGGTGLVGAHLLYELCSKGYSVRALRRKTSNISYTDKIFRYYSSNAVVLFEAIEWVEGDVLDTEFLANALIGITDVYHCAAVVSFEPAEKKTMFEINVRGTANIVNICLDLHIRKLCFVSSIASLGRGLSNELITENTEWKNSKNNSGYSKTKFAAECEIWRGIAEGLPAVIINPSLIIGCGDWNKGSTAMFKMAYNNLKFYTTGINGMVDVRDVARIMVQLTESDICNERFIVSSENYTYKDFFETATSCFNKPIPRFCVGVFVCGIAWRIEKFRSVITRSKTMLTKETVRTANQKYYYSNEKICKALAYKFIPMNESVKDTCLFFLRDKGL